MVLIDDDVIFMAQLQMGRKFPLDNSRKFRGENVDDELRRDLARDFRRVIGWRNLHQVERHQVALLDQG